jgi:hypothetical protein
MNKIEKIKKEIAKTDYQDMPILDVRVGYLGSELSIYIEKNKDKSYELLFLDCYKVSYETDAAIPNWRSESVREFSRSQIGYYGQDFSLSKSEVDDFVKIDCNLNPLYISVTCKNVKVQEVKNKDMNFFWDR